MKAFGQLLKEFVQDRRMTQAELGRKIGLSRSVVAMVIGGKMKLPVKYLSKINNVLRASENKESRLRLAHMASIAPDRAREVAQEAARDSVVMRLLVRPGVRALVDAERRFSKLPKGATELAWKVYLGEVLKHMRLAGVIEDRTYATLKKRLDVASKPFEYIGLVAKLTLALANPTPTAGKEEEFDNLARLLSREAVDTAINAAMAADQTFSH